MRDSMGDPFRANAGETRMKHFPAMERVERKLLEISLDLEYCYAQPKSHRSFGVR